MDEPITDEDRAAWSALLAARDALWQRSLSLWGTEEHAAACEEWLPAENAVREVATEAMRRLLAENARLRAALTPPQRLTEFADGERIPVVGEVRLTSVRAAAALGGHLLHEECAVEDGWAEWCMFCGAYVTNTGGWVATTMSGLDKPCPGKTAPFKPRPGDPRNAAIMDTGVPDA